MKKRSIVLILCGILLVCGCKHKDEKKEKEESFFPVLPIIRSQVADIDTSLYSIRKITVIDSAKSDTVFYRREQFKELASEFLSLPDISSKEFKGRYKEEKQFDETLNRAIFLYLPVDPKKEMIQREELLVRPGPPDQITSIIIDYGINNKDSSVQKKMLWQVDNGFQVTTIRQLPGQKETVTTYKVLWSGGSEE